ncbi:MAG: preprotein translocase subunit SecE [Anaerolineales bacterium]|nr:preprotein translocase subunit SecE [Anaerolineales bacterium]
MTRSAILAEKAKSKKSNPIQAYFRETIGELRKVSWPTRREALQLTGLVIVVMIVVGFILGMTDAAARGLLGLLLG